MRAAQVRYSAMQPFDLGTWGDKIHEFLAPFQDFSVRFIPYLCYMTGRRRRMMRNLHCIFGPQKRVFSSLIIIFFLPVLIPRSDAQREKSASPSAVGWKALIPEIQPALGLAYSSCNADHRVIEIIQTADVTGDNEPEAIVEYCRMGAYTSEVALMRLEYGKPVVARFRDSNGKVVRPVFLIGASVRNGEGTYLLSARNAVYSINWHTDDYARMDRCAAKAFVWTPRSATFDQKESVSKEIAESECARLRKELPTR